MVPEGRKAMAALTPGPKDAEKQENGADNLANPTHALKTIPAATAVTGLRDPCGGLVSGVGPVPVVLGQNSGARAF